MSIITRAGRFRVLTAAGFFYYYYYYLSSMSKFSIFLIFLTHCLMADSIVGLVTWAKRHRVLK